MEHGLAAVANWGVGLASAMVDRVIPEEEMEGTTTTTATTTSPSSTTEEQVPITETAHLGDESRRLFARVRSEACRVRRTRHRAGITKKDVEKMRCEYDEAYRILLILIYSLRFIVASRSPRCALAWPWLPVDGCKAYRRAHGRQCNVCNSTRLIWCVV